MQAVAPDLAGEPADDALAALETRLNDAERIQGLREKRDEDIDDLNEQIKSLEGQRRELAASIAHLKRTASVEDNDKLKAAIERSDNQRAIFEEQKKIIEKLQQDGDGKSIEELESRVRGTSD